MVSNQEIASFDAGDKGPEPGPKVAYDGSHISLKVLRACGWDTLLNYGYHRFHDLLLYPFNLDISQTRLAQYTVDLLKPAANGALLDVACGRGKTAYMLSAQYPQAKVVGVDLLPQHIEIARFIYGSSENLTYRTASANSLPFENEAFDGIHCLEAAFHFDRPKFLAEAYRVLKPGARLVLVDFMWKHESDRSVLNTPEGKFVCDTWQMTDMSSEQEYVQMAADAGFRVASRSDLTRNVTLPILRRMQMMAAVGSTRVGRQVLCSLHQNLRQFSDEDWQAIRESARAHAAVVHRSLYVCLVLEKVRSN